MLGMPGGGQARRRAFAVMLGCAALLSAACAAGGSAPARHGLSVAAAAGRPAAALDRTAARYLAIAHAGNRRLDADFGRLDGRDRNRLAVAKADLRDVAATERLFDRRLLRIVFPPRAGGRRASCTWSIRPGRG